MKECKHTNDKCIDSRRTNEGRRRRYVCIDCGYRYTTVEYVIPLKKNRVRIARKSNIPQLADEFEGDIPEDISKLISLLEKYHKAKIA